MADFEQIVKKHAGADGSIPASAIGELVKAIGTAVGNEFVDKARYKAKLEEIDTLKGEKQTAEDSATTAEKWKTKYEEEKAAHDKTKSDHAAKETAAKVKGAYRAMLKEAGVAEKYLDTVLKATDMSGMKLDKDGKLEGAEDLSKSAKTEWTDFIQTTTTEGAKVATPPKNSSGKYSSREEIMKIEDTTERQAAIAANLELFQTR